MREVVGLNPGLDFYLLYEPICVSLRLPQFKNANLCGNSTGNAVFTTAGAMGDITHGNCIKPVDGAREDHTTH
jgi:hypothetical protein